MLNFYQFQKETICVRFGKSVSTIDFWLIYFKHIKKSKFKTTIVTRENGAEERLAIYKNVE